MEKSKLIKLALENGEVVCNRVKIADSMEERMIGLMFKKELTDFDGLLIVPCNSIHTFFMRMSIDVLFLDKKNIVVKAMYGLNPWRITGIYFKASKVLEMKAGTMRKDIKVGDALREYV